MNSLPILIALLAHPPQAPTALDVPPQHPTTLNVDVSPNSTPTSTLPKTYREAYDLAIHKGKPLIVWSGAAICMPCVKHNSGPSDEFVSFVTRNDPLFPKDSLTVGVPVDGKLLMAGQVESWPDGHIPTVREILRRWRETRRTQTNVDPVGTQPWRDSRGVWHTGPSSTSLRNMPNNVPILPTLPSIRRNEISVPSRPLMMTPTIRFSHPPMMIRPPMGMMGGGMRMGFGGGMMGGCAT